MKNLSENSNLLELAFQMFTSLSEDDFEYIYRGEFSPSISKKILSLAETNVLKAAGERSLKKRIYFLMVEGLQNVTKHREAEETEPGDDIFAIQKNSDRYFITTGNVIKKDDEDSLRPKLEQINLLEADQLKKLHKEILVSGSLSEKGGAGLGLIEMARKSGKKLMFNFDPLDQDTSFFYFRTEISAEKDARPSPFVENKSGKSAADAIRNFDKKLKKENVLVSFNGRFNRQTILSILSIIKGQMNVSKTSKKVYALMVEMLQNISKHTLHLENGMKSKGVFMLSKKDGAFYLTSGNYIEKDELPKLKRRIEEVNSLNEDELYTQYDQILLGGDNADERRTGLGFIDMRIKSKNLIRSFYQPADETHHFVAIQATVKI